MFNVNDKAGFTKEKNRGIQENEKINNEMKEDEKIDDQVDCYRMC